MSESYSASISRRIPQSVLNLNMNETNLKDYCETNLILPSQLRDLLDRQICRITDSKLFYHQNKEVMTNKNIVSKGSTLKEMPLMNIPVNSSFEFAKATALKNFPQAKLALRKASDFSELTSSLENIKETTLKDYELTLKQTFTDIIIKSARDIHFNNTQVQVNDYSFRFISNNLDNEFIVTELKINDAEIDFRSETINIQNGKCEIVIDKFIKEVDTRLQKKGFSIDDPKRDKKIVNSSTIITKEPAKKNQNKLKKISKPVVKNKIRY
jgi:hypothetical protein